MHDCPCCGNAVYADHLLCDECTGHGCEPNGEGAYDDCQVPCNCGTPSLADFYFFIVFEKDGETDYSDGYVCQDHAVGDGETYAPAGAAVLEFSLSELTR